MKLHDLIAIGIGTSLGSALSESLEQAAASAAAAIAVYLVKALMDWLRKKTGDAENRPSQSESDTD